MKTDKRKIIKSLRVVIVLSLIMYHHHYLFMTIYIFKEGRNDDSEIKTLSLTVDSYRTSMIIQALTNLIQTNQVFIFLNEDT